MNYFTTVRERRVGNNNLTYHNVSIIVLIDFIRQEGTVVKIRDPGLFQKQSVNTEVCPDLENDLKQGQPDRLVTGSGQFVLDTASVFFLHTFLNPS